MSEDIENIINNMADELATPDVSLIHSIAGERQRQRKQAKQLGAAVAVVTIVAGIGLWATRPSPTEVSTASSDDAAPSVAEDSAPGELGQLNRPGYTMAQQRLTNTPGWFPIGRTDVSDPGALGVRFDDERIHLDYCNGVGYQSTSYDVTWMEGRGGFVIDGLSPLTPQPLVITPDIGCDWETTLPSPMLPGLEVSIEATNPQEFSLSSNAWELTVSANPRDNEMYRYLSLPVDQAGELAEANGLSWRVVERDGQRLPLTYDLRPDRLNFRVQNDIVAHVSSETDESPASTTTTVPTTTTTTTPTTTAAPSTTTPTTTAAPSTTTSTSTSSTTSTTTTTTTVVEPDNPYLGLPAEDAGALASRNGKVWRVVRIDGVDQVVTMDYRPGRLNFVVEDGLVVEVIVEGEPSDS